ncbi:unnamed protein product [[Candida] boidinii]|nr:unnamed protein product [[Candida] boidinii]
MVTATHETSSGFENAEFTPNMLICIQQMEEEDRELERLQDEQDEFVASKIHDMEYQIDEEKFEKKMDEWRLREVETSKQEKIYLEKVRANLLGLDKDENVKPLKGFEQQQQQQHEFIRKKKIQEVESASESDDFDFELLGNWFAEGTKIGVSNDSADKYSEGNEEKAENFDIEGTKIGVSNDSADKYSEGIAKLEEDEADNSDTEGAEIGVSCNSADEYPEVDSIAESKEIRKNIVETEDKLADLFIKDTEIGVSCDSADEYLKPMKSVNQVVASAKSAKSEDNKFQMNFNNWLDKDWLDKDTEIGGFASNDKSADEYFKYTGFNQEEDESDGESEVKSEEYGDQPMIKFSDMDAISGLTTKFFEQKPTAVAAKDPIESYEKSANEHLSDSEDEAEENNERKKKKEAKKEKKRRS